MTNVTALKVESHERSPLPTCTSSIMKKCLTTNAHGHRDAADSEEAKLKRSVRYAFQQRPVFVLRGSKTKAVCSFRIPATASVCTQRKEN